MAAHRGSRKPARGHAVSTARLPQPDPEAAAHSARVAARIAHEIAACGGAIPFERFMELALYAPGLGYYSAGAAKLGPGGDFTTASEATPLYARCVAAQCHEILEALGGGIVAELGAGSGAFAAELLASLERAGRVPERYLILDVSAELRARQRDTFARRAPGLADRVEWLDRLPADLNGVVIANEVVDALPVALFRIAPADAQSGRVQELFVTADGDGFALVARPPRPDVAACVADIERELGAPLPPGYASECRPRLGAWVAGVAGMLARGVALFVDYGLPRRELYAAERERGTLLCHYRHRVHGDPLLWPGLQDIGAWVDFSALAAAGEAAGLALAGFTTQAHFLIGCGLAAQFEQAVAASPESAHALASAVRLLTLPGEMGERFRVLALARDYAAPLRGFGERDLTRTL